MKAGKNPPQIPKNPPQNAENPPPTTRKKRNARSEKILANMRELAARPRTAKQLEAWEANRNREGRPKKLREEQRKRSRTVAITPHDEALILAQARCLSLTQLMTRLATGELIVVERSSYVGIITSGKHKVDARTGYVG